MIGIYKIISPSGKVYIGQSWNIEKRFKSYKKLQCKNQKSLYNSFIKYGFSSHQLIVIKVLEQPTQEVLDLYEIGFVNKYENLGYKMLNLRAGGKGGRIAEETKKNISIANSKKIAQFGADGKFIKVWNSSALCEEKLKISKTSIRACARGVIKSAGGYMFRYTEKTEDIESYFSLYGRKPIKTNKQKKTTLKKKRERKIYQYDLEGNYIKEWSTRSSAATALNISQKCIGCAVRGILKQTGGFQWKSTYSPYIDKVIYSWDYNT